MNNALILHDKINIDIYIDGDVYIVPCVLIEEVGHESEMLAYTLAELGVIGTGNDAKEALENLTNMFKDLHLRYTKKPDGELKPSGLALKKLILSLKQ